MYTARRGGGFLTDKVGVANFFFLHLLKKEALFCVCFFIKEDHLNYSMPEDSLLAYLLNTLFTGLSLLM